jgi:translation initiation factor IF-2
MINPELPQRTTIMKQLLNGVAIAAVFALATPVFAQNAPMTPANPPKPAPAAPAPAAPKAAAPAPAPAPKTTATKPMMHHMVKHRMNQGDMMTEQLNQQELARIMGGMPPAPAPGPASAAPPPPAK